MALPVNWVQFMIDLYKEGYSDPEVCAKLGISKKQFHTYIANSQAFADLVEYGHDLAEAWAHTKNREFVTDEKVTANNLKALEKRMENLHGWSTKVEEKSQKNSETDLTKLLDQLKTLAPDVLTLTGRKDLAMQLVNQQSEDSTPLYELSDDSE